MNTWLEKNARKLEKPSHLLPPCIPETGGIWADFGCGEGIFTAVLYELVGPDCEIYAVDKKQRILQTLLNNFEERYPEAVVHVVNSDFRQPLDIPALDGFVMANALHFIKHDQKHSVLNQLVKHLKPGGRAVIIEYNARRGNIAVPHPLDELGFLELAKEIGLQDVQIAARVPSSFMGEMYAGVGITASL
jgi:ubiquinone/menaquinone biosynthesis C-methylase UbiE